MSSATNQMNTSAHVATSNYSPVDAVNRHEFGVQKNRKPASTGGGRAWSEEEEVYLLQTRLQKMPYKHIAAHLKKTELACRLHYHQLSHGSNRRKRTNSVASSSPGSEHSPVIPNSMPSPSTEAVNLQPTSPQTYTYSPQSPAGHVQLPSASSLLPRSASNSPPRNLTHPVAILPKPSPPRRAFTDSAAQPPLRLDCDVVSRPMNIGNVDKDRLRHVYEAHRSSFWGVIAAEYGGGVSPHLLEEAWKRGIATNAPPTPCISPDAHNVSAGGYQGYNSKPVHQLPTPVQENKNNATSISALLGIDASPRSPKERELIKRMEESRESRDVVMAGAELQRVCE
ncbi:Uncharacterized protein BP5553_05937 [Venustampulla echinocandica]|uniref:Myb-like domain-containing protein n=1 Tax=Venustampulla echinocandica TaxID=2656787 RepID=A0A370TM35_9HELO|nr:Uncharacterized protein BP5553_05937 [Venustampulla echinocandica]RDL36585.1 Uncharacterized protein BP5553_05937 [Venustampulla echinocandica]